MQLFIKRLYKHSDRHLYILIKINYVSYAKEESNFYWKTNKSKNIIFFNIILTIKLLFNLKQSLNI